MGAKCKISQNKSRIGEVDAGIVYITDVTNQVVSIPIKESEQTKTRYPIAIVDDAEPHAEDFLGFILSSTGQGILNRLGFGEPE